MVGFFFCLLIDQHFKNRDMKVWNESCLQKSGDLLFDRVPEAIEVELWHLHHCGRRGATGWVVLLWLVRARAGANIGGDIAAPRI